MPVRQAVRLALIMTLMAAFGCEFDSEADPAGSGQAGSGAGDSADGGTGPSDFSEVKTLMRSGSVIIEKVRYVSDGLRVFGIVCRPADAAIHSVLVVNHGGFEGIATTEVQDSGMCTTGARNGYVVIEAGYRGEPLFTGNAADVSEGSVEVCLGEVDDVQNLMRIVRDKPYADATRFAAFGASHGGCITQQLVLREPSLRAAVDFFGPTDFAVQAEWWQSQIAAGETASVCPDSASCEAAYRMVLTILQKATGGTAVSKPAEYAARSPNRRLGMLSVPMLFIHGTDDYLVNVDQTCLKRATLTAAGLSPSAWYLADDLSSANPADVCDGGFLTTPGPDPNDPSAWREQRAIVLIYHGQGHGFTADSLAAQHAYALSATFLVAHLE